MGRPIKPPSKHAESLRRGLRIYLQTRGISVSKYARDHGVRQSTLHRFWSGATKEPSPRLLSALRYAQNHLVIAPSGMNARHLLIEDLVAQVTDDVQDAVVLKQLVLALAPIVFSLRRSIAFTAGDPGSEAKD